MGVGRFVAAAALVFLVAVAMGRLLLAPGDLWKVFLVAVPVLLVVLGFLLGLVRAVLLVGLFASTLLSVRWIVMYGLGWPVILLAPVVALAVFVAVRVAMAMRAPKVQ
jgi:hypothetical protein